jgi:sulfoxide reductase heme-binding subunit YedZ
MLGLFAFFYGTLHFLTYFVLDHSLMFDGLWDDVVKRPYITAGFTAFVLMIPLALTSTQGWIRRLGGRTWNLLHRLVYVTAVLAVLHYWWKVKLDTSSPALYAVIVAMLLGARVWKAVARRRTAPPAARPVRVAPQV